MLLNNWNLWNHWNDWNYHCFAGNAFLINSRMLSNSSIHSVVIHK